MTDVDDAIARHRARREWTGPLALDDSDRQAIRDDADAGGA